MESIKTSTAVNLLLIGNNPMELGSILTKIKDSNTAGVIAEIAFDIKGMLNRLIRFTPNLIVIDDNIGTQTLNQTLTALYKNRKTRHIPISVLRDSNFAELKSAPTVLDYILSDKLSAAAIPWSLRTTLGFQKASFSFANTPAKSLESARAQA